MKAAPPGINPEPEMVLMRDTAANKAGMTPSTVIILSLMPVALCQSRRRQLQDGVPNQLNCNSPILSGPRKIVPVTAHIQAEVKAFPRLFLAVKITAPHKDLGGRWRLRCTPQ